MLGSSVDLAGPNHFAGSVSQSLRGSMSQRSRVTMMRTSMAPRKTEDPQRGSFVGEGVAAERGTSAQAARTVHVVRRGTEDVMRTRGTNGSEGRRGVIRSLAALSDWVATHREEASVPTVYF